MDEIAERAGVSKPVLYQHFPGKLELYLALLDAACDQILDDVGAALKSTDDNEARVVATMEAYLGYVARHGGAYRLVFESDLRQDSHVADRGRRVETLILPVDTAAAGDLLAEAVARHRPSRLRTCNSRA